MSRFIVNVAGFVRSLGYSLLSNFNFAYYGMAVHTFSFVDAVTVTKHIGVFKTKRRQRTNFRRA
jgi:hypothetical protein